MKTFFSLEDLDVKNKAVLMRVDFDVPLDKSGNVEDDRRIRKCIPTIRYLKKKKAKIILMGHMGRPKGKVIEKLRLRPSGKRLERLLKSKIKILKDCIGEDVKKQTEKLMPGETILLENLRFYKEEENNDKVFAKKLSDLADFYVDNAFATCHRPHVSFIGIPKYLKSAAGLLLEEEINTIQNAVKRSKKPFIGIIGGVKFDKIDAIKNLLKKVDKLLIGGALAFTFLKAKGFEVGDSFVDNKNIRLARELIKNKKIILPVDAVAGDKLSEKSRSKNIKINEIKKGDIGLDIGKQTLKNYANIINKAKTVVWAGPMGMFECKQYSKGSYGIARAIARCKGTTIVGGGNTAEVIEKTRLMKKMTLVSTGGGACLELLAGKTLIGVKALEDNYKRLRKK